MQWYYAHGNEPKGPVSDEEFQNLVREGTIVSETLVWNQNMSDWTSYRRVHAGQTGKPGSATPTMDITQKNCSECGGRFPQENMIPFNDLWVCAACKPVFIQKLKEGVPIASSMEYAGFWIRFGAWIIDYIIMAVIQMVIYIPFTLFGMMNIIPDGTENNPPDPADFGIFMAATGLMWLLQIGVAVAFETWFVGKYQATPGKMACQIKVVNADGSRVSYLKACGRHFAKWISYIILGIGFIIAAFDDEKRGLHDHICNTRVVRKE